MKNRQREINDMYYFWKLRQTLDLIAEIEDPLFIGNFAKFFSCKPSDILVSEFYYADETAPRREMAY